MTKELDEYAVSAAGVLVEREHHQVAGGQLVENGVEPAPLGQNAETRVPESPIFGSR